MRIGLVRAVLEDNLVMRTSENPLGAKFRKRDQGEVRRTSLPRTRVNRDMEKGRSFYAPAPAFDASVPLP